MIGIRAPPTQFVTKAHSIPTSPLVLYLFFYLFITKEPTYQSQSHSHQAYLNKYLLVRSSSPLQKESLCPLLSWLYQFVGNVCVWYVKRSLQRTHSITHLLSLGFCHLFAFTSIKRSQFLNNFISLSLSPLYCTEQGASAAYQFPNSSSHPFLLFSYMQRSH